MESINPVEGLALDKSMNSQVGMRSQNIHCLQKPAYVHLLLFLRFIFYLLLMSSLFLKVN